MNYSFFYYIYHWWRVVVGGGGGGWGVVVGCSVELMCGPLPGKHDARCTVHAVRYLLLPGGRTARCTVHAEGPPVGDHERQHVRGEKTAVLIHHLLRLRQRAKQVLGDGGEDPSHDEALE